MDLVGAWLRQLVQAGTAAALVPAAIVAALAVVLVGAGGFGGLGALGQLVAGPQPSPAELRARGGEATSARVRDLAPVAPALASESPVARTPAASPPPPPVVAPTPPPPASPPRRVTPPPPPPAPPPPVAVAPPPPPPAAAAPARRPTLEERTRRANEELKETVGELGTAVRQVVEGLGNALGRILAPPAPAPPPPPPAP